MKRRYLLLLIPCFMILFFVIDTRFVSHPFSQDFNHWNLTLPQDDALFEYQEDKGFTGDGIDMIVYDNNPEHLDVLAEEIRTLDSVLISYEDIPKHVDNPNLLSTLDSYIDDQRDVKIMMFDDSKLNYMIILNSNDYIIYIFNTI